MTLNETDSHSEVKPNAMQESTLRHYHECKGVEGLCVATIGRLALEVDVA